MGRKRPDRLSGIGNRELGIEEGPASNGGISGAPSLKAVPVQSRLVARLGVDAEPSSGRFGPFRVIVVPTGPGTPDWKRGGVRTAGCEPRGANRRVRTLTLTRCFADS